MLGVALFYDFMQIKVSLMHTLPFVGNVIAWLGTTIIDLYALLTFFVWFKVHDVSFANPKRGLTMAGALIVELVPILNAVPAWTLAVIICFITVRGEEALGEVLQKVGAAAGAVGAVAGAASKVPLVPKGARQALGDASKAAKGIQQGAYEARAALSGMSLSNQQGFDRASRRLPAGKKNLAVKSKNFDEKQKEQDASAARINAMTDEYSRKWQTSGGEGGRDEETKPPAQQNKQQTASPADIGAQPVFRQTPPQAPEQQSPLPTETTPSQEKAQQQSEHAPKPAGGAPEGAPATKPQGTGQEKKSGSEPAQTGGAQDKGQGPAEKPKEEKPSQTPKPDGQAKPQASQPQRPAGAPSQKPAPTRNDSAHQDAVPSQSSPSAARESAQNEKPTAKGAGGTTEEGGAASGSPQESRRTEEEAPPAPSGPARGTQPEPSGAAGPHPSAPRPPRGGYSRFKLPQNFGRERDTLARERMEKVAKETMRRLEEQGKKVAEKIQRGERVEEKHDGDSVALSE